MHLLVRYITKHDATKCLRFKCTKTAVVVYSNIHLPWDVLDIIIVRCFHSHTLDYTLLVFEHRYHHTPYTV